MDSILTRPIKEIISESIQKGMSYSEYRELVKTLVENKSTTGNDQSEAMVNYTVLSNRRMKRWDKTIKLSDEIKETISNIDVNQAWLLITESWCGDAAHVVPVINAVAELNSGIDLKLVLRDENEALMDNFLTNGGRSIPKLIAIDNKTGEVINTYGPRPSTATQMVDDFKIEHGSLTADFKEDLQRWYNADKGQTTVDDLVRLLL
ncbi:thioredoxin family protein [Mangrovimonas aestuarii]|uniref:thioredoxin family protein n=1 Tax=Mangrovimonas aestuarii TaxID=3018443 RepID=UPI0023780B8D|nr:thioredoxin family protein [Mangrovimonas aestuarii]